MLKEASIRLLLPALWAVCVRAPAVSAHQVFVRPRLRLNVGATCVSHQRLLQQNLPQPNVREPKVCSLISVLSQSEHIQIMSNNHVAFVSVPDFIQQLTLRVRKRY
jgi:hypothetical protein